MNTVATQYARLDRLANKGLVLHPSTDASGKAVGPLVCPLALPKGDVTVTALQYMDGLVRDIEMDLIQIDVVDRNQQLLSSRQVLGRTGLNDLYEQIIGYRPDDDCHLDALELLQLTAEVLYRDVTDDLV